MKKKILALAGGTAMLALRLSGQTDPLDAVQASPPAASPPNIQATQDPSQGQAGSSLSTPQNNPAPGAINLGNRNSAQPQATSTASTASALATGNANVNVPFSSLPPAVQTVLQRRIGTNNFGSITSEVRDGVRLFRLPIADNGRVAQVMVTESGTILADLPQVVVTPPAVAQEAVSVTSTPVTFEHLPNTIQRTVVDLAGPGPYERVEKESRNGAVTYYVVFKSDGKFSRVHFGEDGAILEDSRDKPSILAIAAPEESTNKMTLSDLPLTIQTAIKTRVTPSEVEKVKLERWLDKTVYTVNFYRDGDHHVFRIGKDGNVVQQPVIVSPALVRDPKGVVLASTSLDPKDLPMPVQNAVRKHSQSAPITNVRQTLDDGHTVYNVEFGQGDHVGRLLVSEDGSVVQNEGETLRESAVGAAPPATRVVSFGELPRPVQRTLDLQTNAKPPGDIFVSAQGGKTVYEAEIERDGRPVRLQILEDGSIVKVRQ